MEFRKADPRRVADGRKIDLTAEACVHIADDHTEQDVQTSDKTAEQHGDEQHGEQRHQAVSQPFCQFDHTLGARLKPMIATMAPLTTGGTMMSIHFAPASGRPRPPERAAGLWP